MHHLHIQTMNSTQQSHYNIVNQLAIQKNGKLLSSVYHTRKHKLEFQCQYGHIWKTQPYSIQTSWCPTCLRNIKSKEISDKKLNNIRAKLHSSLELISTEYTPDSLTWKCTDHHISEDNEYIFTESLEIMEERRFQCICDKYM